jgi:ferritin-like protein
MASEGFHEAAEGLTPRTRDLHRALVSLQEELEAIDWYQQRVDATGDPALRDILAHNRDEEKEHAAMVIEWLRRQDEGFDRNLRRYLFTEAPIVAQESGDGDGEGAAARGAAVGSLRRP